jgi:trans-aconitate 2-methyltransferase
MTDTKSISNFYDQYSRKQKIVGINIRHRTILRNAVMNGLKSDHKVLEIGCGVGTVTSLLAKYLRKGKLVSVDISQENIRLAREFTRKYKNIDFMVSDMADFISPVVFDFVILPDVLEHIPIAQHDALFSTIRRHTNDNSVVYINIPDPYSLEYARDYTPELLQIVDQPLYTNILLDNIYKNGFYLQSLVTYSLSIKEGDYQAIVIKPYRKLNKITRLPKMTNYYNEVKSRVGLFFLPR